MPGSSSDQMMVKVLGKCLGWGSGSLWPLKGPAGWVMRTRGGSATVREILGAKEGLPCESLLGLLGEGRSALERPEPGFIIHSPLNFQSLAP